MRVISGSLKGRNIKGYNLAGTRPTMDKVKESLFAIIQNDIKDAICLDLFAGSGSIGIEAISNGAKQAYFIDNNIEAINTIKDNIKQFKIEDKCVVIKDDYLKALLYFKKNNIKFNLIFLDPPYKDKIIDSILNYINDNHLLLEGGQVICEFEDTDIQEEYGTLKCIKNRQYGIKGVKIFKLF